MILNEITVFCAGATLFTLFLAGAWLSGRLGIFDGYVLTASILAPDIVLAALGLLLACMSMKNMVTGSYVSSAIFTGINAGLSFLFLAQGVRRAVRRYRRVRDYYRRFEESVLMSCERISQHDFNISTALVIKVKVGGDDCYAEYFTAKCRKFAAHHGLRWEE